MASHSSVREPLGMEDIFTWLTPVHFTEDYGYAIQMQCTISCKQSLFLLNDTCLSDIFLQ